MALKRVWIPSPNYSSRSGSGVRLVCVHTAEGSRNFRDLGNFFASSSAGVSSHVGIDDEKGTIGEYVKRPDKAWCQGNFNPQCVCVELCAAPISSSYACGANWDGTEWNKHDGMIENLAAWIAEECAHYGLPVEKISSSAAQGSGKGVCGHVDLGDGGGGHWDPGPNFPWQRVMDLARGGKPTEPEKPKPEEPPVSVEGGSVVLNHDGRIEVFADTPEGVHHRWQVKAGQGFSEGWSNLGEAVSENGQLSAAELAPIAEGELAKENDCAASWNAMNVVARERGCELVPTGSQSSYRSYGQQEYFYDLYLSGDGNLAAVPGTSNHGWGWAVDLATEEMRAMVDQIGHEFGWAKEWSDAPSEWWHLKHKPGVWSGDDPGPYGKPAPEPAPEPVHVAGGPVVLNTDGRIEVFAEAAGVHHRWQTKPGGGFNEGGWSSLGEP